MLYKKRIRGIEWIVPADNEEQAEKYFKIIEDGGIPDVVSD